LPPAFRVWHSVSLTFPRLALNLWSSASTSWVAGIIDMNYHTRSTGFLLPPGLCCSNFTVHWNYLGILFKCCLWFSRVTVGPNFYFRISTKLPDNAGTIPSMVFFSTSLQSGPYSISRLAYRKKSSLVQQLGFQTFLLLTITRGSSLPTSSSSLIFRRPSQCLSPIHWVLKF
jgi:hypothetical protein